MTRQTRELLAALSALNQQVPYFVTGMRDGSIPVEKQAAFGGLLVELGRLVQVCAQDERADVVESGYGNMSTVRIKRRRDADVDAEHSGIKTQTGQLLDRAG